MKITRILVYEGDDEWVLDQMATRNVKGLWDLGDGLSVTEYFTTNTIRVEHVTLTGGDPYKEG